MSTMTTIRTINFLLVCVVLLVFNSMHQSQLLHQQIYSCQLVIDPNASSETAKVLFHRKDVGELTSTTISKSSNATATTKVSPSIKPTATITSTLPVTDEKSPTSRNYDDDDYVSNNRGGEEGDNDSSPAKPTATITSKLPITEDKPPISRNYDDDDYVSNNRGGEEESNGNDALKSPREKKPPKDRRNEREKTEAEQTKNIKSISNMRNVTASPLNKTIAAKIPTSKPVSPKNVSALTRDQKAKKQTPPKPQIRSRPKSFAEVFDTKMQQCTNMTQPIRFISIHGERHHGTNFVRTVIKKNALSSVRCVRDPIHGWKHGVLDPEQVQLREDQLLLVVTRDAFSWLPKMYKEMYCFREKEEDLKMSFSDFLRRNYLCYPHQYTNETETAPNIVQIRTTKYKNWLSEDPKYFAFDAKPPFCTRVHLRYESILQDSQEATIGKILQHYNIRNKTPFQEEMRRAGPLGPVGKVLSAVDVKKEAKEILEKYTLDDLQFVLDNLDLELERTVFNYNYDYVLEYMEERASKMRSNVTSPK